MNPENTPSLRGPQIVFGGMVTLIGIFMASAMIVPPLQAAAAHRELREQGRLTTAIVEEKWRVQTSRPLRVTYHLRLWSPELEREIRTTTSSTLHEQLQEGDEVSVYVRDDDALLKDQEATVPWHVAVIGIAVMSIGMAVAVHGIRRAGSASPAQPIL